MPYKHFTSHNMNADYDSGSLQFADERDDEHSQKGKIIISWTGATGVLNGTIAVKLIYPAVQDNSVYHEPVTIDTFDVDSATGALETNLTVPIEKFQIVYTKTGVTGGTMLISLFVEN